MRTRRPSRFQRRAAARAIQKSFEWLSLFELIVFLFDQDEAGREAAYHCAEMFPAAKVQIASLPLNDASEMLQAGRVEELVRAFWGATSPRRRQ